MSYKMVNPNTRIDWIPFAGLSAPSAPTAAQLNAGTRISGAVTTGYSIKFNDSDTDNSKTVEDEGNVETPTLKNYEGKISLFKDELGTAGILAPVITLGTTAGTGGTFTAGPYFWVVVAITASGDSLTSNEVTQTLTATSTQVINWTAVSGATGYKVYRGTAAGAENVLVTTLGAVVTYTDTGVAGTAGSPAYIATVFTTAVNLFKVAYVEGWIVTRYGRKASVAYAAGHKVSVFRFKNDYSRTVEGDAGNPIMVEVDFLPQGEAYPNVAVV